MEKIGIDTLRLANVLGKAHAILHWGAAINGDDEFVLGTSAVETQKEEPPDIQHRTAGLYPLDFGQCEAIDLTQDSGIVYQTFKEPW
jgi:hypothetical protein